MPVIPIILSFFEDGKIYTGLGEGGIASLSSRFFMFFLYCVFCVVVYHFTPIGQRLKMLGDSQASARVAGISRRVYSLIGFGIAGISVGIGGFLILNSYPYVAKGSVSDLGFNIILSVVLGGMPISGGSKSRLISSVFGSFSAILLSDVINMIPVSADAVAGISQLFRAVVLICAMCFVRDERGGLHR